MRSFSVRLLLSLIVFQCGPSNARGLEDLLGVWIIQPPSPPGVVLVNTVTFTERGAGITAVFDTFGDPSANAPSRAATEATLNGNSLSLSVDRWVWKGHFINKDELQMNRLVLGKHDELLFTGTRVFRRSSPTEVARLRNVLPKTLIFEKIPLPTLRDLPPNGLARTPPMGWSSWNRFMEGVNDVVVRETADALVSSGLRDAGYTLVEVDDGWQGMRDENGELHPNAKFPNIKDLINYVHTRGLTFGIYTTPGPISCAGYVGSHGHETQDAQMFARWGIDFVMNDVCRAPSIYHTSAELQALHQKMAEALRATGRPIVYKIHDMSNITDRLGEDDSKSWGRTVGANLWRTGADLVYGDRWESVSSRFERHGRPENSGPGGWNDADNMVIGLDGPTAGEAGLTITESRTHMTLWAMLASPLILGNDVRRMTDDVKSILLNPEVIAIDQDPLGKQGHRVSANDTAEIWVKALSDGSAAVALFNRSNEAASIRVNWNDLNLTGTHTVRDLWQRTDLGRQEGYSALVPAHGAVVLRVTPDFNETTVVH